RLRPVTDGVDALHVGDRRQDAADHLHAYAARVRVRDRALPGRARSLLGDDEPVDRRSGADNQAAGAEDTGRARGEEELQDATEGRRLERQRCEARARRAEARAGTLAAAAAEGAPEEESRASLSEDLTVETTGETVGEAKWAALRELELRHPGLDKSAVRFE